MRKKIVIHPHYYYLSDFVYNIPENFDSLGKLVYSSRNQVRIVDKDGQKLVIKYFKKIVLLNKFVYAHLRKSKARRAYEHSELFLSKGINSPQPVAYMNCYNKGLLVKSYYICLYTDYSPIEELMFMPIAKSGKALEELGRFTYRLHKNGLFHLDYNVSNILYKPLESGYDFTLIDNNRLKIENFTLEKSLKTMCRMKIPAECLNVFAKGYSEAAGIEESKIIDSVTVYREKYMKTVAVKLKWKALKRHFLGIFVSGS